MSGNSCEEFAAYSCSVDSPIPTEWAIGIIALVVAVVWAVS